MVTKFFQFFPVRWSGGYKAANQIMVLDTPSEPVGHRPSKQAFSKRSDVGWLQNGP